MLLMSVLCWVAANASAQGRYTVEKASVVYVDNSGSTLSLSFAASGSNWARAAPSSSPTNCRSTSTPTPRHTTRSTR